MRVMKFACTSLVLAAVALTGCASKPPKDATSMSMHLAATPSLPETRRLPVVLRMPSISLQVDRIPVMTERELEKVELTGEGDAFGMRFVFNTSGTIRLDTLTTDKRGSVIVVCFNGVPVAAPLIRERIVDGFFEFTPDVTRQEAEKLAAGVNKLIAYLKKKPM